MSNLQFWAMIFAFLGVIVTAGFNLLGIRKQAAVNLSVAQLTQKIANEKATHAEVNELKAMVEKLETKLEDCNNELKKEMDEKIRLMIKLVNDNKK